jgi:hypothetical protein
MAVRADMTPTCAVDVCFHSRLRCILRPPNWSHYLVTLFGHTLWSHYSVTPC